MARGQVFARDTKTPATDVLRFTVVAWADFLRALLREELKDS